ncbi:MAG: LacI family DNA-binding transcriptional regulator [Spirochaetaceae bacterium]|jgi:LacI family transcriptional regulator|nr:LacI family DNA-binding transcriptional regulator [Spirochaetaceae bacterium]
MNIYEIAKKAGVSTATISRVLNNSPNVSEKTRAKIHKLMEDENYLPSAYARGLSGTPAKTIGILTIDIRDQYFASVIHSLEQELSLHDYNVVLCNTGGELDDQRNYISLLLQKKVDALILVGSVFKNPQLKGMIRMVSEKIPLIIVNEKVEGNNIYSIVCDEGKGICDVILNLYKKGRKHFVYIKTGDTYSSRRKMKGYLNAAEKLKIENYKEKILNIGTDLQSSREAVADILKINPRPDAVICGEDLSALGIMQQLIKEGFSIPGDFAVTGFNNSIYSQCATPQLTSIDSQSSAMGLSAARLILDVLADRTVPSLSIIHTELIEREST